MTDEPSGPATSGPRHPAVRHAVRILENEHTPVPTTIVLAERVGLSQFYFVHLFTEEVGESPQHYARGVILEHAAGRLRYTDDPIAAIARDFGYAKQATFTKSFTHRYGVSPGRWRKAAQAGMQSATAEGVRLERFASLRCLARRYIGPRRLAGAQWADFLSRLPEAYRACRRIGLAYDDPAIVAAERLRYDCAVIVKPNAVLPEELLGDGFEMLETPRGLWAAADVIGRANVAEGYRRILAGWLPRNPGYTLEGDPFLERFVVTPDDPAREPELTVCLRVRKHEEQAKPNMTL